MPAHLSGDVTVSRADRWGGMNAGKLAKEVASSRPARLRVSSSLAHPQRRPTSTRHCVSEIPMAGSAVEEAEGRWCNAKCQAVCLPNHRVSPTFKLWLSWRTEAAVLRDVEERAFKPAVKLDAATRPSRFVSLRVDGLEGCRHYFVCWLIARKCEGCRPQAGYSQSIRFQVRTMNWVLNLSSTWWACPQCRDRCRRPWA